MRDSFIFYRSFYEAIKDLPRDVQGEIYTAIMEYSLYGKETEMSNPISIEIIKAMEPLIDVQGRGHDIIKSYHWNWKGGVTDENHAIRCSTDYKKWVKSVFERDSYTCQVCGKVGGVLNAHHIKPFSLYPELRLDINNGITLCKPCHILKHKI